MTIETLHIDYGDYLLKCLRGYGVPAQECEDVRQDIYLKLLENGTDLSTIRQPKGFCSCIAHNAAVDWQRKAKRTPIMESVSIVGDDGCESAHPELNAQAVVAWEVMMGNSKTEYVAQALELARTYECEPGVTIYEVIAGLLYGSTMKQVGKKYGVSHMTVSRWVRDWHRWINANLPFE